MSEIIELDKQLFLWLNGLHHPLVDPVMVFFSERLSWILLYTGIVCFLFFRYSWKVALWSLLALALTFAATDQIGNFIKHAVQRPRPCVEFAGILHSLEACSGAYASFVSNHAANIFGLAALSSFLFKNKYYTVGIFLWAALTGYSRIYVGKHYPLDLLGGAVLGCLVGYLIYRLYKLGIKN
jgi:undecaprenyl-diphosphatase